MCEPMHSIVQFEPPTNSDDPPPPSDGGDTPTGTWASRLGNTVKWLKRVGGMFHLSAMGKGHSEALGSQDGRREYFLMPEATRYEASWWNREVRVDGSYFASEPQVALQNAKDYAGLVSIGSLHALRQFLEVSMTNTDNLMAYVRQFRNILTSKGRVRYEHELNRILKNRAALMLTNDYVVPSHNEAVRNLCLGFTRKRHLLVPEWADDRSLWTPR